MHQIEKSTILKWVTGFCEITLGFPIVGGAFIISFWYVPLYIMFFLHIITLFLSYKEKTKMHGSVVGVFASIIGFIPLVGMALHIVSATMLLMDVLIKIDKNKFKNIKQSL